MPHWELILISLTSHLEQVCIETLKEMINAIFAYLPKWALYTSLKWAMLLRFFWRSLEAYQRDQWSVPTKLWNLEDLKRYFRHFSQGFSSEKISISFKWGLFFQIKFKNKNWLISTRDKWPWYFQLLNLRVMFIVKWLIQSFLVVESWALIFVD